MRDSFCFLPFIALRVKTFESDVTKTGNEEQGTETWKRESWNECKQEP